MIRLRGKYSADRPTRRPTVQRAAWSAKNWCPRRAKAVGGVKYVPALTSANPARPTVDPLPKATKRIWLRRRDSGSETGRVFQGRSGGNLHPKPRPATPRDGGGRPHVSGSVVPGVRGPVGVALLQEGVAAFGGLVGHVRQAGRLAGEELLADQAVVDQVEGVLQHPLGG